MYMYVLCLRVSILKYFIRWFINRTFVRLFKSFSVRIQLNVKNTESAREHIFPVTQIPAVHRNTYFKLNERELRAPLLSGIRQYV